MNSLRFFILAVVLSLPAQVMADVTEVDNPSLESLQAQGMTI
ncbi:MAG: hypothetical protein ACI9JP_001960, partial [Granulosicoccus sp.]